MFEKTSITQSPPLSIGFKKKREITLPAWRPMPMEYEMAEPLSQWKAPIRTTFSLSPNLKYANELFAN